MADAAATGHRGSDLSGITDTAVPWLSSPKGRSMANAGSFKKGEKRPNQGKRGPSNATKNAREAIASFVEGNLDRLNGWLDRIEEDDGPKAAWQCFMDVVEYHIPKLARTETSINGRLEIGKVVHEFVDHKK